jgi:aspartate carbamoyltransferase catalytic subunit
MSLANRSLITIDDFSNEEIEAIFALADELSESRTEWASLCPGYLLATLFYEPSTRTRLSFESAMSRLGGKVISCAEMQSSSQAKGETLADTARVVGSYADAIVIRHPWEGAAKVTAEYAGIPVINAGDGGHEHPTQTLGDLFTLRKEKGQIRGLSVALWGDLKHGRTVHSLAYGLARFGADIVCLPAEGMEMPQYVSTRLQQEYNCRLIHGRATDADHIFGDVDAVYVNASRPQQLSLLNASEKAAEADQVANGKERVKIDALYMTRLQREKHLQTATSLEEAMEYPKMTSQMMRETRLKRTLIMHPLPRVDELPHEMDQDPRSIYFKQAAWGVPVRMALLALILGARSGELPKSHGTPAVRSDYWPYKHRRGVRCENHACVSMHESRYIVPEFQIIDTQPLKLRCVYCEHEKMPGYIASAKWHQSTLQHKKYHRADSSLIKKIRLENLLIFDSEAEAQSQGFSPNEHESKAG